MENTKNFKVSCEISSDVSNYIGTATSEGLKWRMITRCKPKIVRGLMFCGQTLTTTPRRHSYI